ncbi:aminoacyl-tRNA hydrolase [Patescibacteria group bacterium]
MTYTIVGLGNPEEKYEDTRHNVGRVVLDAIREARGFSDWSADKYSKSLVVKNMIGNKEAVLVEPDNYMNNSGESVKYFVKSDADVENLIVVHDDMYLPLGEIKISYGKGTGGHNGIDSIIKHIGTKNFTRVRIGVAQKNIFGKIKKQRDQSRFVLGKFTAREAEAVKEISTKAVQAIDMIIKEGREKAANKFN